MSYEIVAVSPGVLVNQVQFVPLLDSVGECKVGLEVLDVAHLAAGPGGIAPAGAQREAQAPPCHSQNRGPGHPHRPAQGHPVPWPQNPSITPQIDHQEQRRAQPTTSLKPVPLRLPESPKIAGSVHFAPAPSAALSAAKYTGVLISDIRKVDPSPNGPSNKGPHCSGNSSSNRASC